ncbi:MAG: DUF1343 domain-containing protein, partial [Thermoanaerobaculia bacterium]|nr:DUF1343 domain-containing protein [Thermoanaerobaculia bacterium]
MIQTGLDRLLAEPKKLRGRRYGILGHQASVTADLRQAHVALAASEWPPSILFGPEHGYYAVEQDMVASEDERDPLTALPIRSLYGDSVETLRPSPEAFADLDLLLVDLQDVGARYYTYAATAVWAAEVALASGLEVWVLDRPNPLGGVVVEGNRRRAGYESFVGAFELPVRHGLTLGELVHQQLDDANGLKVVLMEGWHRDQLWPSTGMPWIAPSPNMPTFDTEVLYPGLCLIEGTTVSEGRGTTRPFQLVGAPWIDAKRLADRMTKRLGEDGGVRFLPTYFRPQFQKHSGSICAGVELVVTNAAGLPSFRVGVELVCALWEQAQDAGVDLWRREAYEFVTDRPAIDLLVG